MDTLLNMVRSPEMVALDMSSMIACNNVARERMLALIEKYGHETVDEACRTLIEQSETLLRERLRELPDGSWRSRQYIDVNGEVFKVNLTMTKRDDGLVFDFSGSSRRRPMPSTARNGPRSAGCSPRSSRCSATTSPGTRASSGPSR